VMGQCLCQKRVGRRIFGGRGLVLSGLWCHEVVSLRCVRLA
jgi:hypothetical protein